jgi:hypothetical protein
MSEELVKGGQGRSGADVCGSAVTVLVCIWKVRLKLRAEANMLWSEGDKLWAEANMLVKTF